MASSSAIASCTPYIPHQPRGFPFPKREYGKTNVAKRSFRHSWFDKWPWLHYCEENDSVVYHTCLLAKSEKMLILIPRYHAKEGHVNDMILVQVKEIIQEIYKICTVVFSLKH